MKSEKRMTQKQLEKSGVVPFLALTLCVLAAVPLAQARGVSFQPHTDYATDVFTNSIASGDFNRDGKLDLVTANVNPNTVSVLLGNGNGTFQPHVEYATGPAPTSVAVGDFNRDGKLDLVTANFQGYGVSVLLGKGDGTFPHHREYPTGDFPETVAVGDLNGDRRLDVVVATVGFGWAGTTMSVLLGNGDGSFQSYVEYSTGTSPWCVAVGDFNHDGKLDLVTSNTAGEYSVSVLLGNGDGTFQPHVDYPTGSEPLGVAVADFNQDSHPDLVTSNASGTSVSVLLGKGDGTFQPHVDYGAAGLAFWVAVGDLNGDGKLDVATGDERCGDPDISCASVLAGNGDGTFQVHVDFVTGNYVRSVAVGDFNRDGAVDLATANLQDATVSVLLNSAGTQLALSSSSNPSSLGEPVTFTVGVTASFPGVGTPRGMVRFKDGTQTLGTAPLVSGQASFTTSDLVVGSHTIRAIYSGDQTFNKNNSAPLVQQVE